MNKLILTKVACALSAVMMLFGATVPAQADEWENWQEDWNEPAWQETTWEEETWQEEVWVAPTNPYFGGYSNCTWSAWQIAYETTGIALPSLGAAGSWLRNAAAMGYTTSNVPVANSIVVWSGHVGYVSAVSEDGQMIYVREGGYSGGYHEGWFPAYYPRYRQALYGYIYLW